MQLSKGREDRIKLALVAGVQNLERHTLHTGRFLCGCDDALRKLIIRVHQQGYYLGLGKQYGKQLKPLCRQLKRNGARDVAARSSQAGDQAEFDRNADYCEDDRDR